ncbi:hypothetical protein C8C84_2604 [Flavobacterium sp. 102]|nr:hypothetical protein C8C84_2594 [Flavobacterium sp. 102]RKS02874.1 hypothetical protein C8C84_2604 [Flavobacterium sp. 102]
MNNFQFISYFVSLIYIFYSLWGRFEESDRYYNLLIKRKTLIVNFWVALLFGVIGYAIDFYSFTITVQTSVYFMPVSFLVILNLFNLLSFALNKRKFYSIRSSIDMSPNRKDFFDLFSTMMIIFLSFVVPIMTFNLILNGRLLD